MHRDVYWQAKHVLVSEYQNFMADLQQKEFRQLFGIAKARFQRAAGLHPLSKGMLSKGIQFIDLARSEPLDLLSFLHSCLLTLSSSQNACPNKGCLPERHCFFQNTEYNKIKNIR